MVRRTHARGIFAVEYLNRDNASRVRLQQHDFLTPSSFISFPFITDRNLCSDSLLLALMSCYIKTMTDNANTYTKIKKERAENCLRNDKIDDAGGI